MRRATSICLLLSFCLLVALWGLTSPSYGVAEKQESPETDVLINNYLKEWRKLKDEFTPVYYRLKEEAINKVGELRIPDYERWDKEYYQPLYAKALQAMQRVAGTDDYLSMWEKRIPQRLMAATCDMRGGEERRREFSSLRIPYSNEAKGSMFYGSEFSFGMQLFMLATLAVVQERRDIILAGTKYEDSMKGEEIRESLNERERIPIFKMGITEEDNEVYKTKRREAYSRLGIWFAFPPRFLQSTTFDSSWYAMAIYSFKNTRARNILFQSACSMEPNEYWSERSWNSFSSWAAYYLTFFPESKELLIKINGRLNEQIAVFQKEKPELYRSLFDESGELLDPSMKKLNRAIIKLRDQYSWPKESALEKYQKYQTLAGIRKLLFLKRSLDFNGKVPENERVRFETFRRESAVCWALTSNPTSQRGGFPSSEFLRLKKGEEHFKNYMKEYSIPIEYPYFIPLDEDSGIKDWLFLRLDVTNLH